MKSKSSEGKGIKLICGNCLEVMKTLTDNSVDSVVTDPPYELGFMGKKWDSTGIANNVEMWKECLRVLKVKEMKVQYTDMTLSPTSKNLSLTQ